MSQSTARAGERDAPPQEVVDLRQSPRYPSPVFTVCNAVYGGLATPWTAQVQNISSGGIALLLLQRFQPGAILSIRSAGRHAGLPPLPLARVVHACERSGPLWVVGCQFLTPLSDELLCALR